MLDVSKRTLEELFAQFNQHEDEGASPEQA